MNIPLIRQGLHKGFSLKHKKNPMTQVAASLNRKSVKNTSSRPTKVLQFGEGNFLRAFVDWMIFELNEKTGFNAGVKIIQPLPDGLGNKLNKQGGLYHVLLNGYSNGKFITNTQLIDVINGVINPYESLDLFIKEAENPDLKFIISNTTEAGITYDESDSFKNRPANSFPGKLLQLLYHRYQTLPDSTPIYILPCELVEQNGSKLNDVIIKLADHWKLGDYFLAWLEEKVAFCNTLVDRIVPGYPKDKELELWESLGIKDELMVEGELFHLWVIEGPAEIKEYLPAEKAGLNVIFTEDLSSYRTQKVRILNGLHTTMVPVGYFAGIQTVREAVEDVPINQFLTAALHDEIIPSLGGDEAALNRYAEEIIQRFKNPSIQHELLTISLNSFSKFKTRVLPSIIELYIKEKRLARHLLFSLACLIRFYKGEWDGEVIPLKDDPYVLVQMKSLWQSNDHSYISHEVLSDQKLWDQDLTRIAGLEAIVSEHLMSIDEKGIKYSLSQLQ